MSLFITIFGGMLLTVLLYAGGRVLKLSNFWAAVLASGVPTFTYMAYAVTLWPGLDVVTLHVIAYPTVAVLLFQLYGEKAGRERGVHWAPKLMVGFFVAITVVFGAFVYIATQGLPPAVASLLLPGAKNKIVHTGFAGVVAHGEDAAKGIGHHLNMDSKLAKLGWHLEVDGLDGLRSGREETVEVRVTGADGRGVEKVGVSLDFGHPGQTPAQTRMLADAGGGRYRTLASLPEGGAWLATLRLEAMGERIVLERAVGGE